MNPALILEMLNTAKKNHGVPLAQIRWDLLFLNRPNFQIQSGIISNGIKPREINSVEMVMSWVMVMDTMMMTMIVMMMLSRGQRR